MQTTSASAQMQMQVFNKGKVKVEAITFDLDDTLYDNMPVIMNAVSAMFEEIERNYSKIQVTREAFRAEMTGRQKELSADGGADLGALRHRTIAFFAAQAGYEEAERVAESVMQVFLRERNNIVLFPGVLETLARLKTRGFKLGAITNGNADMSKTDLKDALEFCVSAGQLGEVKPALRPFEEAVRLASSVASSTIHVGDDLVADVGGSRRAGMRSVWYNCKLKPLPEEFRDVTDAVITDIRQLEDLVELWNDSTN